jgi:hypothetical protein
VDPVGVAVEGGGALAACAVLERGSDRYWSVVAGPGDLVQSETPAAITTAMAPQPSRKPTLLMAGDDASPTELFFPLDTIDPVSPLTNESAEE